MPGVTYQPNIPDPRIAPSVRLAIDWVFHHLNRFSPFDDDDVYCPRRAKPFFELSLMFAVYAAVTGDTASPEVQSAAQLLKAASGRPDFTDWAFRFPADIVNYAELCAAVDALGGDAGELRLRLQWAVDVGGLSQTERLPHRLVELRAALDWAGIAHSLPPTGDICRQTILGGALSAPLLCDSAIYAITHVILFGSRFGLMHGGLPEWLRSTPVRSLLRDLMVVTSQVRNWDLLGELLLCWDCAGFEHDLVTTAGWASFLEAFRADGSVLPSPAKSVDGQATQEAMLAKHVDEASDFDHVYHTTLVAVLAGTLLLNRSRLYVPTALIGFQSAASPTPERLAGIASSARKWLVSLLERIPARGAVGVRALCHALIASWIADTIAGGERATSASFTEIAQYVARSLNAFENSNEIDSVKPTLKLLVEVLLSSEGFEVEPFRSFLTQSVSVLRRSDPVLEGDPSLMDKRILLHSAGILPMPSTVSADAVRMLLDKFSLSASAEMIDALILQVECLTGWGTRPVDAELIVPSLREILAGFAVQRLCTNDLIAAARLLRLQEYLGAGRIVEGRDDLYNALCMHHRTHGPFGWYGPEAAQLRKASPILLEDTEYYLVSTLECLWTLAERSIDGWRLLGSVPRYALLPAEQHQCAESQPTTRRRTL
jgi:hypothetical protein